MRNDLHSIEYPDEKIHPDEDSPKRQDTGN